MAGAELISVQLHVYLCVIIKCGHWARAASTLGSNPFYYFFCIFQLDALDVRRWTTIIWLCESNGMRTNENLMHRSGANQYILSHEHTIHDNKNKNNLIASGGFAWPRVRVIESCACTENRGILWFRNLNFNYSQINKR